MPEIIEESDSGGVLGGDELVIDIRRLDKKETTGDSNSQGE
jgi:hypothetical protein